MTKLPDIAVESEPLEGSAKANAAAALNRGRPVLFAFVADPSEVGEPHCYASRHS